MVGLGYQIEDGASSMLTAIAGVMNDWSQPLANFRAYMIREVDEQFRAAGDGSRSTFARGVWWQGFSPQYQRKTDGVIVPAWGGVPRLAGNPAYIGTQGYAIGLLGSVSNRDKRGRLRKDGKRKSTLREPNVRGRLRPSGTRVTQTSKMMQDTGAMRSGALTGFWNRNPTGFDIGPSQPYTGKQNAMRQFLFYWLPKDQETLENEAVRWLKAEVTALQRQARSR